MRLTAPCKSAALFSAREKLAASNWLVKLVCMKQVKYSAEEPQPETTRVQEIGAFDAKTHLSSLLERVASGESFTITKRGMPIAELRPLPKPKKTKRTLGWAKGQGTMAADFDAPLPDFDGYQ
jgi:prevent-host-death family protein